MSYQPKTGQQCACRPGIQRDNCPTCEGTGHVIDFARIRARRDVVREITERIEAIGEDRQP